MPKTPRHLQKEQTRQKLIQTAFTVFGQKGITTTRMSDIAEAAEVSHGTVFAHFETQEALVTAVIEEVGQRIAARTHELTQSGSTVRELLQSQLKTIEEFEPFYTRLVIESRALPPASRNVLISLQSVLSQHLCESAEREMECGRIKKLPLAFLFNSWVGLINYYLSNGDLFAPGGSVVERCGNELLENYMELITTQIGRD